MATTQGLLDTLDKLSATLAAAVNHQDATIDQLLVIKQIAWLMRNTGGEASLLVSNGIAAGHTTAETHQKYLKFVGGIETAWNALDLTAAAAPAAGARQRHAGPRPPISSRHISGCATGCSMRW